MNRSILYILFATLLSLNFTGCSLFGSSDDEETAEISEDADYAKDEYEAGLEQDGDGEGEGLSDEQFADGDTSGDVNEIADITVEEEAFDDEEFPDDGAEVADDSFDDEDFNVGEDGDIPSETLTENQEEDLFANGEETSEEILSTDESYDEAYADAEILDSSYTDAPKSFVSVKKMKPAAFRRAGANVNRLYVVRQGDTMSSIARKIYGSDKSADLYSWNGHFVGKSIKVGDKIYYSSPRSANDSSMKTYYEDSGVSAQFYSARSGDNIRTIAKKLLGHDRSWMEIYATNPSVDTKGLFSEPTQLRYWQGSSVPAPVMAAQEEEPEEDFEDSESDEEIADLEEDEELEEEVEEVEDVEVPSAVAENNPSENSIEADEPEIPPPAVGKVMPPKPPAPPAGRPKAVSPPPPMAKKTGGSLSKFAKQMKAKASGAKLGGKKDTKIMGIIGALLLLVGIVLVVFIRRGRSKRVNFTHTQV